MKFIISQSELSARIALVSKVVPSRPTHPILANILLVAEDEKLTLTGTDLGLTITTQISATIEESGSITVPAKLFGEIISKMPVGDTTIEVAEDQVTITNNSGGKYQIHAMSDSEWPELDTISTDGQFLEFPSATLLQGFKGTLFAASNDETKQVLTGVNLKIAGDQLAFAATDGHRLSVVYQQGEKSESEKDGATEEIEITIPARALRELERVLDENEVIKLAIDYNQCCFDTGTTQIKSRRLEGQYPSYSQLIPKVFQNEVTVDRKAFLSALERVGILAGQKNNIIKASLNTSSTEISLSVEAADVGSGREGVSAQMLSQEPPCFAFNVKLVTDVLKLFPSSEIKLRLNNATNPIVIEPIGDLKWTYLVMPVQLRD